MIPPVLVSFLLRNVHSHKTIPAKIATIQSMTKLDTKATGIITADVPTTNKMLKMLLPTILPIAMSAFPLRAATTEVNNSGSDVPSATMVSPINLSLIPNIFASEVAASTVTSLPQIISTRPMTGRQNFR